MNANYETLFTLFERTEESMLKNLKEAKIRMDAARKEYCDLRTAVLEFYNHEPVNNDMVWINRIESKRLDYEAMKKDGIDLEKYKTIEKTTHYINFKKDFDWSLV